ncbi:hypothetical protein K402DRAFT_48662 [Aulographum hederae CBS 113979]|uniref:Uncharacterized protein n=1 Tax=Aulographum hederae CBS 113979 TaxID=1176131 RepID=A0A6G1H2Z5_9PEZI|nr:hypothetical protein K402DRAFT_48662 [Aulographum hederae CBS 113979]
MAQRRCQRPAPLGIQTSDLSVHQSNHRRGALMSCDHAKPSSLRWASWQRALLLASTAAELRLPALGPPLHMEVASTRGCDGWDWKEGGHEIVCFMVLEVKQVDQSPFSILRSRCSASNVILVSLLTCMNWRAHGLPSSSTHCSGPLAGSLSLKGAAVFGSDCSPTTSLRGRTPAGQLFWNRRPRSS